MVNPANEIIGSNILKTIPSNERVNNQALIDKLKAGEIIESFETQRRTKTGKILDIWLTVTALKYPDGKPYAISTTERNITAWKKNENRINVKA